MGGRDWLISVPFVAMVVGLTAALSSPLLELDRAGAVAAAIAYDFNGIIDIEPLTGAQRSEIGSETLCLDTNGEVEVHNVGKNLASTILRVIPESECSKKVVESDFSMFASMTNYYNERGILSSHLKIVDIRCDSYIRCSVDIDSFSSGMTYNCIRSAGEWIVSSHKRRWVV